MMRHSVRLSRKKKKKLLVPLLLLPLIAPSSRNERKRLRSHSTDDGEEEDGSATEAVSDVNKFHRVHEAEQRRKEHDDGQNGNQVSEQGERAAAGKPIAVCLQETQDCTRPSTVRAKVIIHLLDKHPNRVRLQFLEKESVSQGDRLGDEVGQVVVLMQPNSEC
ncbi:hypothetical protein HAX54_038058 [Datura stramonium]|uniref:Uncharacterized protein n=1 Tax=Datura stramonium TaxID=4076 RepID=A0ABS8VKJ7_DATST|nr:hypothetical protein [Datura stramonium]